jgi:hypothetical protein
VPLAADVEKVGKPLIDLPASNPSALPKHLPIRSAHAISMAVREINNYTDQLGTLAQEILR